MFPRLRERAGQNAGTLSGGEQQMLALGRAMMSEPQLICLDEPSLGLAPMVVQDIFRTIRTINDGGTSVLLVEQNARYALETASRGYVLQTGSHRQRQLRDPADRRSRAAGLSRRRGGRARRSVTAGVPNGAMRAPTARRRGRTEAAARRCRWSQAPASAPGSTPAAGQGISFLRRRWILRHGSKCISAAAGTPSTRAHPVSRLQIEELQGDFDRMQGGPQAWPRQKRLNFNRLDGVSLLQEQGVDL